MRQTCYYELLGVARTASQDDIKKAYRKQALLHHPDKNKDNIEEATRKFALIQHAYSILNDPHERAWYDGHREQILRGEDVQGASGDVGTSVDDLMKYFGPTMYNGFGDDPKGFYAVYRTLFTKLAMEEREAFEYNSRTQEDGAGSDEDNTNFTPLPDFGDSSTPYDSKRAQRSATGGVYVKDFYNVWLHFVTRKRFAWRDKWRLSEAPDRRVRRLMEKENRKERESGKKEFNEAVRNLVEFVRKRDPRYKAHQALLKQEAEKEASRLAALKKDKEALAQARKAHLEKIQQEYQTPDWVQDNHDLWLEDDEEDSQNGVDTEDEIEDYYCAACHKTFRSEQQWRNHEASKKHLKNLHKLKRQMRKEARELGLEEEFDNEEKHLDEVDETNDVQTGAVVDEEPDILDEEKETDSQELYDEEIEETIAKDANSEELEAALHVKEEDSIHTLSESVLKTLNISDDEPSVAISDDDYTQQPKIGKAKAKRQKKKLKEEQAKAANGKVTQVCNICGEQFDSRNQLFGHVKATGHALAVPVSQLSGAAASRIIDGEGRKKGKEKRK
ncbi:uncharacterized protein VTP21DRAFT_217 [Calcarisporiella thermophila]|uniref:uncharacterized protein n=1 Tax=Calcarisporiella thermophila TaxID=911321 RepID=UPI0037429140